MRAFLKRVVDVRKGEGVLLAQAFFTLFGLIAGHTILETARDALFLDKLPANRLTFVYALLAGLAFVSSGWNARFVQSFGRRYALIFTLVIAAYGTTILHFQPESATTVFVLYLWSGFLGTVMIIQFWMFASQLMNVAQGKRLYGLVASGGVLGAVAGASGAAVSLEFMPVDSLLLVSSALFIGTALLLTTVVTAESRLSMNEIAASGAGAGPKLRGLGIRALFTEHPYLARMALLVALSTAAVLATDYLFKFVAASTYEGKALGVFFARYYAVLNAASLVVQVGIAGRVIRNQGVLAAMMVLPFMLLGGALGILAAGGLLTIVLLTKGADGALRHSLHRVSSELLWMPVAPEARDHGKALIDGVIQRGTQAATAGVILLLSAAGMTSPRVLAVVILILVVAWIACAFGLRRPYLDLFRQALRKGTLEQNETELDLESVEAVLESLSSRDPQRALAAMELLAERKRSRLIPALILNHKEDEVLVRALEIVSHDTREDWIEYGELLLTHPSESVRVAVVRAFAVRGKTEQLEKSMQDPSPAVRAHAAFCLAHCDPSRDPLQDQTVRGLLALGGEEGKAARIALLQAIRDHADPRWADLVLAMIDSEDREVVEEAAETMSCVKDLRFIPILMKRLGIRDGRGTIRDALVMLGEPALDALEKALKDPESDPRVRLHIPRTISRFGTQRAANILTEQLDREPSGTVRYKVLRGLGRLVAENEVHVDRQKIGAETTKNLIEHLRMLSLAAPLEGGVKEVDVAARASGSLLLGLIEDKARQALERAFRLLQIAHKNEDLRSVFLALQSSDPAVRANAQEFLDVLTSPRGAIGAEDEDRRELLRIAADDLPSDERVSRAERFLPDAPLDYHAAVRSLVRDADEYLASLASYHALEIGADTLTREVIQVYEERPSLRLLLARATAIPMRAPEPAHG